MAFYFILTTMNKINLKYELFKFSYFPSFERHIDYLANKLADKEPWDFLDSRIKSNSILKNYLEFTFRKLMSDKKIVFKSNNSYACFNTGLTTSNLEDIFAFFEKYKNPKPNFSTPFCFQGFFKKSDSRILKNFSSSFPEVANYFDRPELLIFNPKCDLIPDLDHILNDNISRFPDFLHSENEADLRRRLVGAIEEVKQKVRTNYKIAVPQYFDNKIQLLLPLCLTPGSSIPDLALVVYRLDEKTYSAKTCLTLKMAYSNARLIVKPQSNWLIP